MSGMFDSKQDKANKKLIRTKQEEKAKKKTRIITISIITALLIFSATAIIINSGFIRRTAPAVSVDGVNFSAAEFEFFFNNEYMEYVNFMSQFQGMGAMPEQGIPLSKQIYYVDPESGEVTTWAEFMTASAFERMAGLAALYNAAVSAGFKLSDEQIQSIDDEIAMLELQALFSGFPNTNTMLQQMFGTGMNEKAYRNIMEFIATANSYNEHVRESFTYTSDELAGYYAENKDDLDVFTYRQFTVFIDHPNSEDFDDDEYDTALEEATEAARLEAETLERQITGEDDFNTTAANYNEVYSDPDSTIRLAQGNRLDFNIADWLLDPTRKYGDTTITETDHGFNIILFVLRDDNNYRTVGMRQILILREQVSPDDFTLGTDDPGYIEALNRAETEATQRADEVLSLFLAAGETEDALIGLMAEHSDDTTEGGYYPDIAKFTYQSSHVQAMKVVPEIEDWLFDENRQIGDSHMVHTSAFGYHLLYFTGFGDIFFEIMAEDRMRTRDHTSWLETLEIHQPVKRAGFIFVHV